MFCWIRICPERLSSKNAVLKTSFFPCHLSFECEGFSLCSFVLVMQTINHSNYMQNPNPRAGRCLSPSLNGASFWTESLGHSRSLFPLAPSFPVEENKKWNMCAGIENKTNLQNFLWEQNDLFWPAPAPIMPGNSTTICRERQSPNYTHPPVLTHSPEFAPPSRSGRL